MQTPVDDHAGAGLHVHGRGGRARRRGARGRAGRCRRRRRLRRGGGRARRCRTGRCGRGPGGGRRLRGRWMWWPASLWSGPTGPPLGSTARTTSAPMRRTGAAAQPAPHPEAEQRRAAKAPAPDGVVGEVFGTHTCAGSSTWTWSRSPICTEVGGANCTLVFGGYCTDEHVKVSRGVTVAPVCDPEKRPLSCRVAMIEHVHSTRPSTSGNGCSGRAELGWSTRSRWARDAGTVSAERRSAERTPTGRWGWRRRTSFRRAASCAEGNAQRARGRRRRGSGRR